MTKYGGKGGAARVVADIAEGNASPMETVNMIFGLKNLGAKKTSLEVVERLEVAGIVVGFRLTSRHIAPCP